MKYNKFSRRMFLQGSGALLSIPFLESLAPSEARAQAAEPIKRYFFFNMNFDVGHARNWLPQLTTLANPLDIPGTPHKGSFERLSAIRARKTQLSPIFGNAFDPFIEQMMFYKGLDIVSHGYHQNANCYALGTMWSIGEGSLNVSPGQAVAGRNPATETFDRLIARNTKFDPGKRPSLNLRGHHSWERDSLGNIVAKGGFGYNALEAYKAIFNNGTYPESGAQPIVHSRRDLLTRVMEDYSRVINGRQIGNSDKIILTSALDSVADLQRGLTVQATSSCRHTDFNTSAEYNQNDIAHNNALGWSNYVKLVTAIFQCDISRSVTLASGPNNFEDWTTLPTKDWHENITHANDTEYGGRKNWQLVGEYYGRHFNTVVAPILTSMDSCIDPANNKSFLHNGLAHITAESTIPHRQVNLPNVTVGSLNGAIPTGYMVNYTNVERPFRFTHINGVGPWSDDPATATNQYTDLHTYDYPGIPYQRFLVTLCQAMGLSPSDYEDPNLNKHVMNRNDSLFGEHNNGITHIGGFGISSLEKIDDIQASNEGLWQLHVGRMKNYNWHHYKYPVPLPPKV